MASSYAYDTFSSINLPNIPEHIKEDRKEVKLNDLFFACFCTERYDKTRKLILNGNDLYPRIGRRFDDNDVEDLLHFLKNNFNVNSLSLAYNYIHCEGFIDIIDYIIANNQLLELNVQNNEIGVSGIQYLCKNVSNLKVKTLRLNGNKFKFEAAQQLALMLVNNNFIEHLDIAEVDQKLSSLVYFITILRPDQNKFNNTLKILDLSKPIPGLLHAFDSSHFATLIGSMLKINKCLIELHLQKCNFSCHDIELMITDAKYNKTLQLLDLGCNNIGDHGIDALCNWLRLRPILAGLILCHNIIKNSGARALSFAMPFSRIRFLDISYNNIDDDGTTDILNTIKKSTCMRNLRIFGNKINNKTAEIINRMLKSGVLIQNNIDVKPYEINKKLKFAYYPADHYKQRYYDVPLYAIPQPLKILRDKNIFIGKIPPKIIFKYIDPVPIKSARTITKDGTVMQAFENIYPEDNLSLSSSSCLSSKQYECIAQDVSSSESLGELDDKWNRYCYCSSNDHEKEKQRDESLSYEQSSELELNNDQMHKVMLILEQASDNVENYIMKWINAADAESQIIFSSDDSRDNQSHSLNN